MGNTASRYNDQRKPAEGAGAASRHLSATATTTPAGEQQQHQQLQRSQQSKSSKKLLEAARKADAEREKSAADAATAQRQRQASTWSLGSLSGRLNWSFTGGATRNSFHNRNKSTRKSLTSAQQQRRSKTVWHKPLTNAIFSSHFKESSRNDQFHIESLVAKGAFGVVFKVYDKKAENQLQQQHQQQPCFEGAQSTTVVVYALKVLRKSKIIEENSVQQIKDEADIQKLCGHHPFIVQQVDLWQNRRNLHILSEYVPNGELFSKIRKFSIDLIRLYLAEIALAIDFLHNAGVIYRDVKPENILLTANYHIKLTDFGLSKWLKLGATTKTLCGTFQYMAPEILRGQTYGHAVDWWSLGVIACEMFTETGPDIKQFLNVSLPSHIAAAAHLGNEDHVDNIKHSHTVAVAALQQLADVSNEGSNYVQDTTRNESQCFLPNEVAALPHEAKDVLKRLLVVDPQQRIRSVLALQKIALYKNFKIDSKHLLSIRPLDIINKDQLVIYETNTYANSALANDAFQHF